MIEIRIEGKPAPAGSKRAFGIKKHGMYTGRHVVVDTSGAAGRDWRALVQDRAKEAMKDMEMTESAVKFIVHFVYQRPKYHYGKDGKVKSQYVAAYPKVKPDLTKVIRAVEDALTGIVWKDDTQVVAGQYRKTYGPFWSTWMGVVKLEDN